MVFGLAVLGVGCGSMAEEALAASVGERGVSVLDFGARADGTSDDTGAIQAAIDAATVRGGTVYLPAGEYRVAGNLDLKEGVALVGVNAGPMSMGQRKGTILLAAAGRGDEDAAPFIHMTHATTVRGVTIYYPQQRCDAIVPYPWTLQLEGFDTTVEDVTFINSYNGIRTGPANNVRHRIRSVAGTVLRRGLYVDYCTDIGRVENVQFHCHWWSDPVFDGVWDPVFEYMWNHLEAFAFARTDWEYVTNNFVFPASIGWRFVKSENGASNGHMTGCGADATQTAVRVDDIQPMGWLISGGQFVSMMGDDPVQVRIGPDNVGSVRFVNAAFWGPSNHNAIIEGNGFASFSDCYFSSDKDAMGGAPLLVARSGRIQVHNSTFATSQPSIELGPEVAHAIIRGNNGPAGVQVVNHAKRAIVADNEENPVQWTDEARAHFTLHVGTPGDVPYLMNWHGSEPAWDGVEGRTSRWSRAASSVQLPVLPGKAYEVSLDVQMPAYAAAPESGLYMGDTCIIPLTETHTGVLRGTLPAQDGDAASLRFAVHGWVPTEHDPTSSDTRTLGVSLVSVTLRAEGADSARCFDANTGEWSDTSR